MNRLSLYIFYERDGIVRDYVIFYLRELKKISDRILVVVNGKLTDSGKSKIEALNVEILVRENAGLDFWGWKAGQEYLGWDEVRQYDELVLTNCSCYGPVFPFHKVFDDMRATPADFWGLVRHPHTGDIPAHLQSYFLVIRSSLLISHEFQNYWDELPAIHSWKDAVMLHEVQFTRYFEQKGFTSASYIPADRYAQRYPNPTFAYARELLEDGFPLVKRKLFSERYDLYVSDLMGDTASRTMNYLRHFTRYDTRMIYEDLNATQCQSTIRRSLHHTYILDDYLMHGGVPDKSIALIHYAYFEDLAKLQCHYIQSMPRSADIYIVSVSEKLLQIYHELLSKLNFHHVEYRLQPNRGRNESAYWVTCQDVVQRYDYLCLIHDKKTPSAKPLARGENFARHCFESLLANGEYVSNILATFAENPHIGLLMPTPPVFAGWDRIILQHPWGDNKKIAQALVEKLKLTVPFDPDCFSYGSMFWLRQEAMKPLFRHSWTINDMPPEPLQKDGTILHALERLYPMIAQEAGFCSGWIMPNSLACVYHDNQYFMLQHSSNQVVHFQDVKRYVKHKLKKFFGEMYKCKT